MSSSVTKFANLENVDEGIVSYASMILYYRAFFYSRMEYWVLPVNTYRAIIVQIFSMGQRSGNKTGHFIRYEKGSLKNGTVVFAEW